MKKTFLKHAAIVAIGTVLATGTAQAEFYETEAEKEAVAKEMAKQSERAEAARQVRDAQQKIRDAQWKKEIEEQRERARKLQAQREAKEVAKKEAKERALEELKRETFGTSVEASDGSKLLPGTSLTLGPGVQQTEQSEKTELFTDSGEVCDGRRNVKVYPYLGRIRFYQDGGRCESAEELWDLVTTKRLCIEHGGEQVGTCVNIFDQSVDEGRRKEAFYMLNKTRIEKGMATVKTEPEKPLTPGIVK